MKLGTESKFVQISLLRLWKTAETQFTSEWIISEPLRLEYKKDRNSGLTWLKINFWPIFIRFTIKGK